MLEQRNYWKITVLLSRCVATITFLCERCLALRRSNEIVGSRDNGNYLSILELIGQFDPFLSQHIHADANRGCGTIYEELVAVMGKRVIGIIKDEIAMSRYFSVLVDSTPGKTHTDLFHESVFFVATCSLDVRQSVKMLWFMSLYYEISIVVLSLFFLCCYFSLSTFHL